MKEGEKGEKQELRIWLDEWGRIEKVKDKNGNDIKYADGETKKMDGTDTRLLTPNDCCWRYINGWKCSPLFC